MRRSLFQQYEDIMDHFKSINANPSALFSAYFIYDSSKHWVHINRDLDGLVFYGDGTEVRDKTLVLISNNYAEFYGLRNNNVELIIPKYIYRQYQVMPSQPDYFPPPPLPLQVIKVHRSGKSSRFFNDDSNQRRHAFEKNSHLSSSSARDAAFNTNNSAIKEAISTPNPLLDRETWESKTVSSSIESMDYTAIPSNPSEEDVLERVFWDAEQEEDPDGDYSHESSSCSFVL